MLPISIAGYYIINRIVNYKVGLIYMLICSLVFVAYMNIMYLYVLLIYIVFNYAIIHYMNSDKISHQIVHRKLICIFGIVIDAISLIVLKYADFFVDSYNKILKIDGPTITFILPLGVSFYTFQMIACIVDCYRNEKLSFNILEFSVFMSFYPQFVQGPILLHDEMIPQLNDDNRKCIDYDYMYRGLCRFIIGLAKKVLIADNLGMIVDGGYSNLASLNSISAITVVLTYTLQIYFDFSGYSDMAIGIGLLFHIDLPENFNSPYKAVGIGDFWDRWHITLTRFFTRYIYIPLGGSHQGDFRTYINIFIVFIISGIWHGSSWTFVAWGCLHGVAMILERVMRHNIREYNRIISKILLFIFVNLAWIFFRADSWNGVITILGRMISGGWSGLCDCLCESINATVEASILQRMDLVGLNAIFGGCYILLFVIVCWIACFCSINSLEISKYFANNSEKKVYIACAQNIILVILAVWSILSFSGVTTFVYWNF